MRAIEVVPGQRVYFDPFADMKNCDDLRGLTEGKVDFINRKAGWFSVVYGKLRTSFFFTEIGKKVFHDRSMVKQSSSSMPRLPRPIYCLFRPLHEA